MAWRVHPKGCAHHLSHSSQPADHSRQQVALGNDGTASKVTKAFQGHRAWATAPAARHPALTACRCSCHILHAAIACHTLQAAVAAMLSPSTAHLPVTHHVPPTACHMLYAAHSLSHALQHPSLDPQPTLSIGLITCVTYFLCPPIPSHTTEHSHTKTTSGGMTHAP